MEHIEKKKIHMGRVFHQGFFFLVQNVVGYTQMKYHITENKNINVSPKKIVYLYLTM